jgi:hypothetical protein
VLGRDKTEGTVPDENREKMGVETKKVAKEFTVL